MSERKANIKSILDSSLIIKRSIVDCHSAKLKNQSITPSQWSVLAMTMEKGKTHVKEISSFLKITSSAATQLVDGLCEKGFLCRQIDKSDRRRTIICPTKEHAKEMAEMRGAILNHFEEIFQVLDDAELSILMLLNEKIARAWSMNHEKV